MDLHPCKRTGACCQGRGHTPLTTADIRRAAEYLSLSETDFRLNHTDFFDGRTVLKNRTIPGEETACTFLRGNECSIHAAKPEACSTWPLWAKLYEDAGHYRECQSYCGMIRAIPHADFKKIFRAT